MNYTVAVRALCEFTAKAGDLDLRFTPSPTAQEGIAGHGVVAARRGLGYEAEVSLCGDYQNLHVRGRADGYDSIRNQLEEVKTYRGDLALMPANHRRLHWAQVKLYGALLCRDRNLNEVSLALVYFDIATQKETLSSEKYAAADLQDFFEAQCELFLVWAEREMAHRQERDRTLNQLVFPHAAFREGQRPLAEAVYKAASVGCCLMAQAPTGIGKTVGTLFPMLKAMPLQHLDRVFFLAAKTPGRRLALDALERLGKAVGAEDSCGESDPASPLRVLELVARDKACEYPDRACHGESCPLASGFYDRLPKARLAALDGRTLDQTAVRTVALEHDICPYYLAQELARWSDVIVGDYNYYFGFNAMLYGLTTANQWRIGVLVDEAHNLVERACGMYTAALDQGAFRTLRRTAPAALKKPLDRVNRQWNALNRQEDSPYQVIDATPAALAGALQAAIAAISDYMAEAPQGIDGSLQTFYFDAMHFCRIAALSEENDGPAQGHFLIDLNRRPSGKSQHRSSGCISVLCLRNLVPASFLKPRFEASRAVVLFSATLGPRSFYRDLLGLPERTSWVDVDSPFVAEQLTVRVIDDISTRFQHRAASVAPIARLIAGQYRVRPGNYLAFFSSFDYLEQAVARIRELYPEIPIAMQTRRMDEPARQAFLHQFDLSSRRVGFAVLGGAFAEGIDLPGERLVGAFIATLGLPQMNPVNEQIKQRMGALFGAGYDYTYVYPGLRKVVQAAGRVIRTQKDQGIVYLIDDRYSRRDIQALLPPWWRLGRVPLAPDTATAKLGPGNVAVDDQAQRGAV